VIGCQQFINHIAKNYLKNEHQVPEIPSHKKLHSLSTIKEIQNTVINVFDMSFEELLTKRYRKNHNPRAIAMYLCVKLTDQKLTQIALAFRVKSQSTVSRSYKKIQQSIAKDNDLQKLCAQLESAVNGKIKT